MKNTLFVRQLKIPFNRSKVAAAVKRHNVRLSKDNPNYDPDLSINNKYYYQQGNKLVPVTNSVENMERFYTAIQRKEQRDLQIYLKNIADNEQLTDQEKKRLSVKKAKLKTKIKGWLDSENTTEAEKKIYSNLQKSLNSENIESPELALAEFNLITSKISRRNDKFRAIESMGELMKLNSATNRNYQLKIRTTEYVFKIPDLNNINVSADDWFRITQHFLKENYPDYKILMIAIHADENPNNIHPHILLSGLNVKTKQYDLPNHDMEIVKKYCVKNKIPIDWHETKNWNELSSEQHKRHGEIFQDLIFKKMNGYINKLNYNANFVKRTPEEIEEANHKYQKKMSSTKREHNRQNKIKIDIEREEEKLQFLKDDTKRIKTEWKNTANEARQDIKLVKAELEHFNKNANKFTQLMSKMSYFVTGAITSITKWVNLDKPSFHPAEEEKTIKCDEMVEHFSKIKQIAPDFDHLHCANGFLQSFTDEVETQKQIKEIFDQTMQKVPEVDKKIILATEKKRKW